LLKGIELQPANKAISVNIKTIFFFILTLPKHVALLSVLKPGEVRIETDTGVESIYVSGGIVEVQPNVVTIFSDSPSRIALKPEMVSFKDTYLPAAPVNTSATKNG
jgi:F0F1-type ATP synthase epsilon subunit